MPQAMARLAWGPSPPLASRDHCRCRNPQTPSSPCRTSSAPPSSLYIKAATSLKTTRCLGMLRQCRHRPCRALHTTSVRPSVRVSFDIFVIYFEANMMIWVTEYFYAEFMDSSLANDDKDEDQTVMMRLFLKKWSMRRSMLPISRVQQRDIDC